MKGPSVRNDLWIFSLLTHPRPWWSDPICNTRTETERFSAAVLLPLASTSESSPKQICGIALADPARLNKRAVRMRTPPGWISPSDVRLRGVCNDAQMKTDPPSS